MKCPRCGGGIPNDYQEGQYPGAISRTDNVTEICSSCGTEEALQDAFGTGVSKRNWVKKEDQQLDMTEKLIKYENDELSQQEIVVFFQELVDTGMAWQLQGHYGRMAQFLINEKLIEDDSEANR